MKIRIYVQPAAKKSGCAGYHGELVKIKLNAPPVDGAANTELVAFISDTLSIPKSRISISSGHASRTKTIDIDTELPESSIMAKILSNIY